MSLKIITMPCKKVNAERTQQTTLVADLPHSLSLLTPLPLMTKTFTGSTARQATPLT